jgi:hypothetical protein
MNLIFRILIFLSFFTSSGDIFFNPQLFGFSFRYTYFINIFLLILLLFYKRNLKIKIIGISSLFIWAFGEALFIPHIHSFAIPRNIGYFMWFIWNILYIITLTYLANSQYIKDRLIKDYMLSFILVAIFGFIQFILYPLGVNLLVRQTWPTLGLARINGFSYEPSYFGTYLIIGWNILFTLYTRKEYIYNKLTQNASLGFITLVIILSSSRMTILIMLIRLFLYTMKDLRREILIGKMRYQKFSILAIAIFGLGSGIFYFSFNQNKLFELLQGTGIGGTADHSSSIRGLQMEETWEAFTLSPFIGHSFGGIDVAVSDIHFKGNHQLIRDQDYTGMNIFLEQLVSAGIIFYPFFLLYLFFTFYSSYKLYKKLIKANYFKDAIILYSLLIALFFELLILCLNQGILRPYLWILIAVLNFHYFANKYKYNL